MERVKPILVDEGPSYLATGLVHRILKPNTSGPHPTVVILHGRFGNEDVMWVFAQTVPPNWLIVAPRAIVPEHGGYSWHPAGEGWPQVSDFGPAETAVSHFIHALPQQYNADPNHIYLMGFSQGAATAYLTAMQHPGSVQGIAGLVGFMPEGAENIVANAPLRNVPVFMAVGEQDSSIPLELSRNCGRVIRTAGAWLEYREYRTGHRLNRTGMDKLQAWWRDREFDWHQNLDND